MKQAYQCEIVKKERLDHEVFKLFFKIPEGMDPILPGQFFNLVASESGFTYLRRPISVSLVEDGCFELTIKILGKGTKLLYEKAVGDTVDLLGPLGNGFFYNEVNEKSLIIGGGIGISPMKELARYLKEEYQVEPPVILGYREETFDIEDFSRFSSKIEIATESGCQGHKGYVTPLIEEHLKRGDIERVYVCGPHVMLNSVHQLCSQYKVETQLLMEERMACGIGACLVCTCAIKEEEGIENKRVCKDGPVFYGSEVVFDV